MPKSKRDKKKSRKSRKHSLSTAEILKLIKKVRPKTSQIVRINMGDKGKEKSSYTPPFIVPQPIVTYDRTPSAPLPPPPPRPAPTFNAEPVAPLSAVKQIQKISKPLPSFDEIEAQKKQKKQSELAAEFKAFGEEAELSPVFYERQNIRNIKKEVAKAQEALAKEEEQIRSRSLAFTKPRLPFDYASMGQGQSLSLGGGMTMTMRPSTLSSSSSTPTRFLNPVQNDVYQPALQLEDYSGTSPNALPSDQWTGTPEGEEASQASMPPPPPEIKQEQATPEEVFAEEAQPVTPPEEKQVATRPLPKGAPPNIPTRSTDKIQYLNQLIQSGELRDIPEEYLIKQGKNKGLLKQGTSAAAVSQMMINLGWPFLNQPA